MKSIETETLVSMLFYFQTKIPSEKSEGILIDLSKGITFP